MNNKDVIYRPAMTKDIPTMVSLLNELFSIEKDFIADDEKQAKGLRMLLESPCSAAIIVAEINGAVVGMCSAQLLVSTALGAQSALIEDVVVTEKFHRKGIGSKLLAEVLQWCAEKGACRAQLLADKTNQTALDFYNGEQWGSTRMICLKKMIR